MPSRNVIKQYSSHSYYHVYNRGVAKQLILSDAADKKQFLAILSRYLDPANTATKLGGVPYRKFDKDIELLCYYLAFMKDYEDYKAALEELKYELANT